MMNVKYERMHDERGMTLIEITFAMSILAIAIVGLFGGVVSSMRLDQGAREKERIYNAVQAMIEQMREQNFSDLYALYNADPQDDPQGVGTGPGNTFPIQGLNPVDGATPVGTIVYPEDTTGPGGLALRETFVDSDMGMPMDLDGDGDGNGWGSGTDTDGHNTDYMILPIKFVIQWKGVNGDQRFEFNSVLTDQ